MKLGKQFWSIKNSKNKKNAKFFAKSDKCLGKSQGAKNPKESSTLAKRFVSKKSYGGFRLNKLEKIAQKHTGLEKTI